MTVFAEFALLLLGAALAGLVAVRLKQPVLIAYMLVGIAVGPAGLGWVSAHDQIELLAQVGVTVLLFLVGLKLDITHVRHIGPVALATGLGQLLFTIVIGFALVLLLGSDWLTALYVAVALTFSSTIIIVKLLSDKRELDSLHGRIAVGFLIVQDMAVVLAMMVTSTLGGDEQGETLVVVLQVLARLLLAAALVVVFMRWVLPWLMRWIAQSQELLLIFALAWGTCLAMLGEWAGFSKEAGAFVAGFTLASSPYRDAISARLSGLRDFLLLFFFVELGSQLALSQVGEVLWPALVLSVFVLVGNPLIVMAIMGYMGYRRRTGFMAGLTVAQISEFSIIFIAMGITLGHIGATTLALVTLVGVLTIAVSTYMILYSQPLYERLSPWLGWAERRHPFREQGVGERLSHFRHDPVQVWVFGLGRMGEQVLRRLQDQGIRVAGVDFDPEVVGRLRRSGYHVVYGDVEDPVMVESLPLHGSRWLLTTLPTRQANHALMQGVGDRLSAMKLAVVVRQAEEVDWWRLAGAQQIINPFQDAMAYACDGLMEDLNRHREAA